MKVARRVRRAAWGNGPRAIPAPRPRPTQQEPAELSVGGRGPGAPRFRIDVTAFEGALSQDRKEQLAADVHAAVCAAAGIEPQGSKAFHIWTLIHEVPEGNWAGGGKVIYYQQVKGLVAEDTS
jgi:phenylpyruvate tautomerase PptA (4-oxalocrotonate tautomerase family)